MKYSEAPAALDRTVLAAENSAQQQPGHALVVARAKGLVMEAVCDPPFPDAAAIRRFGQPPDRIALLVHFRNWRAQQVTR